jgi:hypothetical protein
VMRDDELDLATGGTYNFSDLLISSYFMAPTNGETGARSGSFSWNVSQAGT